MRFPLAPLAKGFESDEDMGAALGRHRSSVARARERGLDPKTADTWACKLGLHPVSVWPNWYQVTEEGSAA